MTLTRLSSGYWLAWWGPEIWAQWPVGRALQAEHFFHPAWTYTAERVRDAEYRVGREDV